MGPQAPAPGRNHEAFASAHGVAVFDDLGALVTELAINRR
jgi:hypothetical protein